MGIVTTRGSCLGQEPVGWASSRETEKMAKDTKPLRDGLRNGAVEKAKVPNRPFDIWLQKQLHAMYDEVASEPLPEDLLKLIERDAGADKKPENK